MIHKSSCDKLLTTVAQYYNIGSTAEMKLLINFTCLCTFSLNFENHFLEFPWEIVFGVISDCYFYL